MTARLYSIMGLLAISQLLVAHCAHAQATTGSPATLELGEVSEQPGQPTAARQPLPTAAPMNHRTGTGTETSPASRRAPAAGGAGSANTATSPRTAATAGQSTSAHARANPKPERVEFKRHPLRIVLGDTERLVTFPHPIAMSLPAGAETLIDMQIIGRTAYVTMAANRSAPIRVLAEDLVTGQTIPLDLLGGEAVDGLSPEIEVHYDNEQGADQQPAIPAEEPPVLDVVQLTRYAAQSVYAPRRLLPAADGVHNIPLDNKNVEGLFRGVRTMGRPLGQWRSGDLYVTAVLVVNLEKRTVTLDLEQVRGRWIAATLQHHRIQAAGSELDSTTVYLVCGQPFHSCR